MISNMTHLDSHNNLIFLRKRNNVVIIILIQGSIHNIIRHRMEIIIIGIIISTQAVQVTIVRHTSNIPNTMASSVVEFRV